MQAIARASGYVETDSGAVVRALKSTYKRHGTLNLFAALEVATGQVHTQFTTQKKREDFRGFLDGVIADLPPRQGDPRDSGQLFAAQEKRRLACEIGGSDSISLHSDFSKLVESN